MFLYSEKQVISLILLFKYTHSSYFAYYEIINTTVYHMSKRLVAIDKSNTKRTQICVWKIFSYLAWSVWYCHIPWSYMWIRNNILGGEKQKCEIVDERSITRNLREKTFLNLTFKVNCDNVVKAKNTQRKILKQITGKTWREQKS